LIAGAFKEVLFHFRKVKKGNDSETTKATMEGLAFPSPQSREAGSEEAVRTFREAVSRTFARKEKSYGSI